MKKVIFIFLLLAISGIIMAQDMIILKDGTNISAIIISSDDTEIKYKKFGQPEPAGIYSVFISDIASIHYKNGKLVDYSKTDENATKKGEYDEIVFVKWKVNMGFSGYYLNRNTSDNLTLFWTNLNQDNSLKINENRLFYSIDLSMTMPLGRKRRNWTKIGMSGILSPSKILYASNTYNGLNEMQLKFFTLSACIAYGHSINYKRNLILFFESGIDMADMNGKVKMYDVDYKVISNCIGTHFATGIDWLISKIFSANFRVGYRLAKLKDPLITEASNKNFGSATGWYVDKSINEDLVTINTSGLYASVGLAISFNNKIKIEKPK